ncbi:MAG: NADH:ubiquinone reductase (Na(+)-transporting) subunit E [Exilispira sp.]|jgi:Na+-transporting NADH:ubiquinone oxidoreductase subunit E|nr:NADH:ubiquinone reductase (Na(+)-transporting) subunit E [Exilispira sp.]
MNISSIAILFGSIFTGNILLSYYLGMCSFLSISRELKSAIGLGVAVTFVMAITTPLNWIVYNIILVPLNITYLRFIVFIMVIAGIVQILEMIIERFSQTLYFSLGIFLPLITVNCAILGVNLFMIIRQYSFINSIFYGIGSGIGWLLAITLLAAIKQKISKNILPKGVEGAAISLIISGIMAIAFMGFSGIIPIN